MGYSPYSLRVRHNCRNTHILKVKNEWLYEYRVNLSMLVVYSHDLRAEQELSSLLLPRITREYIPHVASMGKDHI